MMKLAFDTKLRRPACVLVAAALGGDIGASGAFPAETWLLAPTDDMKVYEVDAPMLHRIVETVTGEVDRIG